MQPQIMIDQENSEGKFLSFWTADQLFAMPIFHVQQIISVPEITHVPDSMPYTKGIINLRGSIIPVIDMRVRLSKPEAPYTQQTCIIITNIDSEQYGFIVDGVDEVANISDEWISPSPQTGAGSNNEYVSGVACIPGGEGKKDRIMLLLDISKIVAEQNSISVDS